MSDDDKQGAIDQIKTYFVNREEYKRAYDIHENRITKIEDRQKGYETAIASLGRNIDNVIGHQEAQDRRHDRHEGRLDAAELGVVKLEEAERIARDERFSLLIICQETQTEVRESRTFAKWHLWGLGIIGTLILAATVTLWTYTYILPVR